MNFINPRRISLMTVVVLLSALFAGGQEFSPQSAMADSFSDYSYSGQYPSELFWGSRWVKGTLADCGADASVAVNYNIPNGRLEISPLSNAAGTHVNGLRSKWKMNFQDGYVQTEVLPGNALAEMTVGIDCANWFRVRRRGNALLFQSKANGGSIATLTSVAYDQTAHKYWRVRHVPASGAVVFETGEVKINSVGGKSKEKRIVWTPRSEAAVNFSLSAINFSLAAGTDQPLAGAQLQAFDNFLFTSNNPVARLPINKVTTAYPATDGAVRNVTACSQLQTAIDAAQPGDTVTIAPALSCTGNFIFPVKNNPANKWIVVRSASSAFDSTGAVREGRRVDGDSAQHVAQMPKLRTRNRSSVISFQPGANYYRVVGLDVGIDDNYSMPTYEDVYALVGMDASPNQVHHVTIDRCYIHGSLSLQRQTRRAVALNGAHLAVVDSYIVRIFDKSSQAQGIAAWSGTGPLKIENNRLESTGQDILLGGDGSSTPLEGISDVVIRRNYFYKTPELYAAYPGEPPPVNGIEIKQGVRVRIHENFFEKTKGGVYAKSTYENGCAFCLTENITVENNKFKNVRSWFAVHGGEQGSSGTGYYPQYPNHLTVQNNLAYFTNPTDYQGSEGASARDDVADVRIIHNTYESEHNFFTRNSSPNVFNFEMRDNIFERRTYGLGSDEAVGSLNDALFPYTFRKNVLVNNSETTEQSVSDAFLLSRYPCTTINAFCTETGTYIVSGWDAADAAGGGDKVGFVESSLASRRATANYRLASGSPYKNNGTDGRDIGAIQDEIDLATGSYLSGIWEGGGTGVEVTPVSQKPFSGVAPNLPATVEAENFDAGGEGVAYHETFGDTGSSVYRRTPSEAVDVQSRVDSGYNVFEAAAGEWVEYTVNVPSAGKYNVAVRYASEFNGGQFRLEDCGANPDNNNCVDLTGQLTINSTGSWSAYKNTVRQGVQLSGGIHVLRLVMTANATDGCACIVGNFDSIIVGAFNSTVNKATQFDFDGDGRSDVSLFRPSGGNWYWSGSTNGFSGVSFGFSSDISVPGDYDGDGKTDVAIFRPSTGVWVILNSSNYQVTYKQFGMNGDVPVQSDYDGDGRADIAVFRPSNGGWYRLNSGNNAFFAVTFGMNGDRPAVGDYDGDGKSDVSVFRPSSGAWYRINSGDNQFVAQQFGTFDDTVTPADYDGDGKTDIAVYRSSTGAWYRINSGSGQFVAQQFGIFEDIPVPGDYDGDGQADIAVFRPSTGVWHLLKSSQGYSGQAFGMNKDVPAASAYIK